jgi:hypothetical protein
MSFFKSIGKAFSGLAKGIGDLLGGLFGAPKITLPTIQMPEAPKPIAPLPKLEAPKRPGDRAAREDISSFRSSPGGLARLADILGLSIPRSTPPGGLMIPGAGGTSNGR